ncbi:hypothetical protein GGQ61_001278 [Phenylobacterium haematophilum]|uniref:Imm-5-like domain-containing protein n=1 Tax=Phenylobacterium haematophilum TaxID=98513 RepID=A0A839ZYY9_9CAUL|nr:hypothetical protein [Phenylobacterium haematophilum]MBB3890561.1 hypothetical protein [Phenylobacterium haematophilum]
MDDLRAVTRFSVWCATPMLHWFEDQLPHDIRPRLALGEAQSFADGARRSKALRTAAWGAEHAAKAAEANSLRVAAASARAARAAAASAFLHPLPHADQVKHIVGAAAHAAHAIELATDHSEGSADRYITYCASKAPSTVVRVLRRYPPIVAGRGRIATLSRQLDEEIRSER